MLSVEKIHKWFTRTTRLTRIQQKFSGPIRYWNWLNASINGPLSMSPIVPPSWQTQNTAHFSAVMVTESKPKTAFFVRTVEKVFWNHVSSFNQGDFRQVAYEVCSLYAMGGTCRLLATNQLRAQLVLRLVICRNVEWLTDETVVITACWWRRCGVICCWRPTVGDGVRCESPLITVCNATH